MLGCNIFFFKISYLFQFWLPNTTKRFPKKSFANIKKWGASVKLAPQIWIIHNFLNFDHRTSKLYYLTPPNDHQTISCKKTLFFHSCCANFMGMSFSVEEWGYHTSRKLLPLQPRKRSYQLLLRSPTVLSLSRFYQN